MFYNNDYLFFSSEQRLCNIPYFMAETTDRALLLLFHTKFVIKCSWSIQTAIDEY